VGRITARVTTTNAGDPLATIVCDALVDTGASGLVLPVSWKGRLGSLQTVRVDALEAADQRTVRREVCGPVRVQIEGFPPVLTEVTFLEYSR
jgi:ribosomal protein S28E/S33